MLIRRRRSWELPESEATPEATFWDRRRLLGALAIGAAGLAVAREGAAAEASGAAAPEPSSPSPYRPAPTRNERYTLDRPVTSESLASRHNIFDEMTLDRSEVWRVARGLVTSPWPIHIGGQVKTHLTLDVADLVRRFGVEERLYRFRCVETWAMAVPWVGFPMRKLIELAEPASTARYVRMVTVARPEQSPGWYASKRVFPYYEALRLDEATNELAFLATGIYGHPLPPQHGAPLRLVVPWKYGLKNVKSIVAFELTAERPGTFWNELSPTRYDFFSNVDPTATVPWPQAMETMLGSEEPRPTLPFNGYAEQVASLYA